MTTQPGRTTTSLSQAALDRLLELNPASRQAMFDAIVAAYLGAPLPWPLQITKRFGPRANLALSAALHSQLKVSISDSLCDVLDAMILSDEARAVPKPPQSRQAIPRETCVVCKTTITSRAMNRHLRAKHPALAPLLQLTIEPDRTTAPAPIIPPHRIRSMLPAAPVAAALVVPAVEVDPALWCSCMRAWLDNEIRMAHCATAGCRAIAAPSEAEQQAIADQRQAEALAVFGLGTSDDGRAAA